MPDCPQMRGRGDYLHRGQEDGVLDEVRVAARHADIRADGG